MGMEVVLVILLVIVFVGVFVLAAWWYSRS